MNPLQSTVEKFLYIILVLSILVNILLDVGLYLYTLKVNNIAKQIEDYDRCIVEVFTLPNRAQYFVKDINNCSLQKD